MKIVEKLKLLSQTVDTNGLKSIYMDSLDRKSKFWSKIEILVESRNFGRKSKFRSKVEILVESRNFGRKLKFFFWDNFNFFTK